MFIVINFAGKLTRSLTAYVVYTTASASVFCHLFFSILSLLSLNPPPFCNLNIVFFTIVCKPCLIGVELVLTVLQHLWLFMSHAPYPFYSTLMSYIRHNSLLLHLNTQLLSIGNVSQLGSDFGQLSKNVKVDQSRNSSHTYLGVTFEFPAV